jgi:hypothetical protein
LLVLGLLPCTSPRTDIPAPGATRPGPSLPFAPLIFSTTPRAIYLAGGAVAKVWR